MLSCGLRIQVCFRGWAGSQVRNSSKAITKAEAVEKQYLLACSLWHAQLTAFLIQPRHTCLKMAWPIVGWTLLHSLTSKKTPTRMPIGQFDGGNPQLRLSEITRRLGDRFKTVFQWESRPNECRLPGFEESVWGTKPKVTETEGT